MPRALQAVIWLDLYGKPTSPEAIDTLLPHVVWLFNKRFAAFATLLQRDVVPTSEAVDAEIMRFERDCRRRNRDAHKKVNKIIGRDPDKIATFVAEFVATNNHGPTWTEVADARGWCGRDKLKVIYDLQRTGWLVFTKAERSLRPGPLWHAAREEPSKEWAEAAVGAGPGPDH